jgi:hypothetical protein
MKALFYIPLLIAFLSCAESKQEKPLVVDVTADIVVPKHYIVTKTGDSMVIDGLTAESSWTNSVFTDAFIDIEGVKTPKFKTRTKMLWDDTFLYVYAEIEEPHIWGDLKQRDTIIFYNNDFEIFIDPLNSGAAYGEIEINALNTVWDLSLDKPYRVRGRANDDWNLDDLKSAVQVYGTLNDSSDIDSLWTLEIAIPLQPYMDMNLGGGRPPEEGEQWRINFSRVQWDHEIINGRYRRKMENGEFLKEYNWVWSNQKVINMHEPEKWGYLQFTQAPVADQVEFISDADLEVKQAAYALFRRTRFGDLKYLGDHPAGYERALKVVYSKNSAFEASFKRTYTGFEYELQSPVTNQNYNINQEGILNTL